MDIDVDSQILKFDSHHSSQISQDLHETMHWGDTDSNSKWEDKVTYLIQLPRVFKAGNKACHLPIEIINVAH